MDYYLQIFLRALVVAAIVGAISFFIKIAVKKPTSRALTEAAFAAYISGVLYGLLSHEGEYQRALEYGNAVSALKNTIPGDLISTDLKEIEGIIKEHKSTGRISEMDR